MSEEFEVPSPHEHEVEHRAQHDPFAGCFFNIVDLAVNHTQKR